MNDSDGYIILTLVIFFLICMWTYVCKQTCKRTKFSEEQSETQDEESDQQDPQPTNDDPTPNKKPSEVDEDPTSLV